MSSKFEPSGDVLYGETADIYFARTIDILRHEKLNPLATMEVFSSRDGMLCGVEEVKELLTKVLPEDNREVWALDEGETMDRKEVVLRITAPIRATDCMRQPWLVFWLIVVAGQRQQESV